jgi:EmrB/QacA subfamily drug resistance transporter
MTRRGATLAVLCAMALMIVLDSTIVAVAVPSIQHDLGFSPAGVAWVINAYLVSFAGLLLLAGRLGDLVGPRRVFLAGLALFTVASLWCAAAFNAPLLIAGRFLQGAGGALASAVILGMIVRLYPAPAAQARALGIYSFTQAFGAAIGFVAGGVLTDAFGWPAIFIINVPIGVAVFIFARRLLPVSADVVRLRGLDLIGAVLVTAGLSSGVLAIVDARFAFLAVLLLGGFLLRQKYARNPLIPLFLLARSWLLRANAAMVLLFATGMGFQFLTALFVQRVMGYDALGTGLAFLPTPIVIGVMSLFVAARLTARFGPRRVLLGGLSALLVGLLLLARMPSDASYRTDMLPPLLIMGLGVGVAIPAVIMLAMAGAAPSEAGLVSGLGNTAQQAGGAMGLAVLAAVAASRTAGRATVGALRDGYSSAFLTAAGFVLAALLLTAFLLRRLPATDPPPDHAGPSTSGVSASSASAIGDSRLSAAEGSGPPTCDASDTSAVDAPPADLPLAPSCQSR